MRPGLRFLAVSLVLLASLRMQPAAAERVRVTPTFFGMHVEQQFYVGWPAAKFSTQRAWGVYPAITWDAVNPAPGTFAWAPLDRFVTDSLSRGVELVYVFGPVPLWASSRPTAACGEAPRGSCHAPDLSAWTEFVTQVTKRYKGRIKYWELWNEPDAKNFWGGTHAEMVEMARRAYPIIKAAGGIVLSPSPQGKMGPAWMEDYLAAGGAPFADINAFHAYLYDAPEALLPLVAAYRSLFARYEIGQRPLWDTEHSWGEPDSPFGGDADQQSAWLARFQILSVATGIDRSIWYGWHHDGWGTLFRKKTRTLLKTGVAYNQLYDWLVNTSLGPCRQTGSLYECPIVREDGSEARAVWSTGTETSIPAPAGYGRYRTIEGQTVVVPKDGSVPVGMKPVLLEATPVN